jgi:hypothetical protein
MNGYRDLFYEKHLKAFIWKDVILELDYSQKQSNVSKRR